MSIKRDSVLTQLRLQDMARFHVVPMMRVQTVADHTYGVMVIARGIAKMVTEETCYTTGIYSSVLLSAFEHDMDEAGRGDIPPKDIPDSEFKTQWETKGLIERIVKLADIIEAWVTMRRLCPTDHGLHVMSVLMPKIRIAAASVIPGYFEDKEEGSWNESNYRIQNRIFDEILLAPVDHSIEGFR